MEMFETVHDAHEERLTLATLVYNFDNWTKYFLTLDCTFLKNQFEIISLFGF